MDLHLFRKVSQPTLHDTAPCDGLPGTHLLPAATFLSIALCTLRPSSAANLAPSGPVGETLATWSVQVSDGALGHKGHR